MKKILIIVILTATVSFISGFLFTRYNINRFPFSQSLLVGTNRNFIINFIHDNKALFVSAIARVPAVFEGFNNNAIIFTDNKGQRHELSTANLYSPVKYWAAVDNDLDVPISKDSFVPGAKIIVTLEVNPYNGEMKTILLELDKSRS